MNGSKLEPSMGKTPTTASPERVTRWLDETRTGRQEAIAELLPLVYGELRRVAGAYMRRERSGQTLQPTALVHEAYLRLVDTRRVRWESRAHFLSVAAQAMRRILVDAARARGARKRGRNPAVVPLDEAALVAPQRDASLVALDDALNALAEMDPRKGRVVELRYFGGLSVEETAAVLHVSPETVHRDWRVAKSWLLRELGGKDAAP